MADNPRVVIIGGHGKIALHAAPKLIKQGFAVESLIRNSEQTQDVEATGASAVVLDVEQADQDALQQAFDGATAVVFSAGAGGGNPARTHAVDYQAAARSMDAAAAAGVSRYVMVSYARSGADLESLDEDNSFYPYAKAKHDADEHLRASGLDYTILGPGGLTTEPASSKLLLVDSTGAPMGDTGTEQPSGDTSRENVAEVITHVIATGAGSRRTINFFDGQTPLAEAIGE